MYPLYILFYDNKVSYIQSVNIYSCQNVETIYETKYDKEIAFEINTSMPLTAHIVLDNTTSGCSNKNTFKYGSLYKTSNNLSVEEKKIFILEYEYYDYLELFNRKYDNIVLCKVESIYKLFTQL